MKKDDAYTMHNDTISRQAAIEAAYQGLQRPSNSDEWKRILEQINAVPSAVVEPVKRGRWVIDEYYIRHCPFCKAINNTVYTNYCPDCGAKMESEDETN